MVVVQVALAVVVGPVLAAAPTYCLFEQPPRELLSQRPLAESDLTSALLPLPRHWPLPADQLHRLRMVRLKMNSRMFRT
jgi:hypothetical protein